MRTTLFVSPFNDYTNDWKRFSNTERKEVFNWYRPAL